MTNFTKNLMVAAAALVVTAGAVSAQTLKADIPFAFQVSGKVMPAGTYQVDYSRIQSDRTVLFRGVDNRYSALAIKTSTADAGRQWREDGRARLAFECGTSVCSLTGMWDGTSVFAYGLSHPRTVEMGTRIAVVIMRPDNGE
ncbi:MAG TPA: hypothetical protein VE959_06240 [Bryobacteraceae bacterium]|nr:hypothetical protein [Bryobacteraceae bacterium]